MTSSQRTSKWSDLACRPAFISLAGGRCQAKEPIKRNNSLNDTSHCQLMFVVNTVLQRDEVRGWWTLVVVWTNTSQKEGLPSYVTCGQLVTAREQ